MNTSYVETKKSPVAAPAAADSAEVEEDCSNAPMTGIRYLCEEHNKEIEARRAAAAGKPPTGATRPE
jgi:hypothetical protein